MEGRGIPPLLTIVATGLTSGLGLETLKQLVVRDGVYRVIIGSRNFPPPEQANQLLALRSSSQTTIEYLPLDLTSPTSVEAFPEHVKDALLDTRIDILLLCAGTWAGERRTVKIPGDSPEIEETLYVNIVSQALLTNRLLKMMTKTGRISIVNSGRHFKAPQRTRFEYFASSHRSLLNATLHMSANCQDTLVSPLTL